MGDVINLNKARKARLKAEARGRADANRAKFGRTKAEKEKERHEKDRLDKLVDGSKIQIPPEP